MRCVCVMVDAAMVVGIVGIVVDIIDAVVVGSGGVAVVAIAGCCYLRCWWR